MSTKKRRSAVAAGLTAAVVAAGSAPAGAGAWTVQTLGNQGQLLVGVIDTTNNNMPPGLTDVTRAQTQCSGIPLTPVLCCDTQAFQAQYVQAFQQWSFGTVSNFNGGCSWWRGYRFDNLEGPAPTGDLMRHKYIANATGGKWLLLGDNEIRP